MIQNDHIKDVITAAVTGDAAGYTLDGMKSKHINAVFRNSPGIPDPAPALKNNIERWRKPGLYSSISQLLLLTCASVTDRYFDRAAMMKALSDTPELPEPEYSYFRNPGAAEREFISRAGHRGGNKQYLNFDQPCGRVILLVIPFLLIKGDRKTVTDEILKYISLYTSDPATIASSVIFLFILKDLMSEKSPQIMKTASESAEESVNFLQENQSMIFDCGMNPDYVISEAKRIHKLIPAVMNCGTIDLCEKTICSHMNLTLKSPIARASVNHPIPILVFALFIAGRSGKNGGIFHDASRQGGSASALTAAAGAFSAASFNTHPPEIYMKDLINRKRLLSMIDMTIQNSGRERIIKEMFESEPPLTLKEHEEYKSKNKKNAPNKKPGKPKTRKDMEADISKHVVESWTKIDKAKWKKEKKKHNT